ncbi:MAG: homocysteine S-methyltransferase family protein [Firmicutes bacterium]|nr:homocysteine S-methyltransferase family protein [Bacillota bacterium]
MKKITLLDGASGTMLWNMAAAEGTEKMPVWKYNVAAPRLVERLALEYLAAGSEIIYSNTFCANPPAAKAEGCSFEEIIDAGVSIAKDAARGFCTKVALDFGPLTEALEPFGGITEEEYRDCFRRMCRRGAAAGADLIVLETFMDGRSLKIAAEEAAETGLPLMCSLSFAKNNRTFFGTGIDEILEGISGLGPMAIGLNCSFGPLDAQPVIEEFSQKTDIPLLLKPNTADMGPEEFAKAAEPSLPKVSFLGACCGSDPSYIRALRQTVLDGKII